MGRKVVPHRTIVPIVKEKRDRDRTKYQFNSKRMTVKDQIIGYFETNLEYSPKEQCEIYKNKKNNIESFE